MTNKKIIYPLLIICILLTILVLKKTDDNLNNKSLLSISIDNNQVSSLPVGGNYDLTSYTCDNGTILSWDKNTNKLQMQLQSKGSILSEACMLNFTTDNSIKLLNTVPIGSYVSYTGTNGCPTTEITGTGDAQSSNSCEGKNANQNSDTSNYTYGYCSDLSHSFITYGWRVAYNLDSDEDGINETYIVSAGSPQCISATLNDSITSMNTLNNAAIKYCNPNYAYGGSCQSTYDASSANARAMNGIDFYYMIKQIYNVQKNLTRYGAEITPATEILIAGSCYGNYSVKECGYNNDLFENGGGYWYASPYDEYHLLFQDRRYIVYLVDLTTSYGIRPVVHLKQDVLIVGGKGTIDNPYILSVTDF